MLEFECRDLKKEIQDKTDKLLWELRFNNEYQYLKDIKGGHFVNYLPLISRFSFVDNEFVIDKQGIINTKQQENI